MKDLSRSVEDYLKAIYQLTEGADDAATTSIAAKLGVSPASVTGMIKRMAESGLVDHEPYRGARLTSQGRRLALGVVRRHRVIETYLISRLGYDWSIVHDEAERLEHAASEDLIERMAFALGFPEYDPHGAPIPTREGDIEKPVYVRLADVDVGAKVSLRRVEDEDSGRLRYLQSLGLVPPVDLEVVSKEPFGGPITVRIGEKETRDKIIGSELAGSLLVDRRK